MRFTVEIKRNQNEMTEVGEKGKRRGERKEERNGPIPHPPG